MILRKRLIGGVTFHVALQCLMVGFHPLPNTAASAEDEPKIRILHIHPEPAANPLLKYRLLPSLEDQFPGNAAVFYGKVFAEQQALMADREYWEQYGELPSQPLSVVRDSSVVKRIVSRTTLFDWLTRASRASHCDWQVLQAGDPYYSILLPELQQTRAFARLLALKVRYEVSQNDYAAAASSLRSSFALARHASTGQTLVHPLVGSAMIHDLFQQLLTWIEQPHAPNLYWALTALPHPMIDFRAGLESNRISLSRSFPVFQNIERDDFNDDYWTQQLEKIWKAANDELSHTPEKSLPPLDILSPQLYPIAKQTMIDEGYDADRVDAMPVARVVLMHEYETFQQKIESRYPLTFLPYPQAIERLRELDKDGSNSEPSSLLSPFEFSSSLEEILGRQVRADMAISLLRTIEAIRMHASQNGGGLPNSLDEIKVVPVPNDPMTGQPFPYQLAGDTATIAPALLVESPNQFQIKIAKENK